MVGVLWVFVFGGRCTGRMLGSAAAGGMAVGEVVGLSCARKPGGGVCDNIAWFRK